MIDAVSRVHVERGPAELDALLRRVRAWSSIKLPGQVVADGNALCNEIEQVRRWQDISTAPKDGRQILLWMVHANAKYSVDPIAEGWAAPVIARWIDHNGGGWTWHGLCGVATHWKPLGDDRPVSGGSADG